MREDEEEVVGVGVGRVGDRVREREIEIEKKKSIPAGNNCEQFPDPHHFLLLLYNVVHGIFFFLFFLDGWRSSGKERGT